MDYAFKIYIILIIFEEECKKALEANIFTKIAWDPSEPFFNRKI